MKISKVTLTNTSTSTATDMPVGTYSGSTYATTPLATLAAGVYKVVVLDGNSNTITPNAASTITINTTININMLFSGISPTALVSMQAISMTITFSDNLDSTSAIAPLTVATVKLTNAGGTAVTLTNGAISTNTRVVTYAAGCCSRTLPLYLSLMGQELLSLTALRSIVSFTFQQVP